MNELQLALTQPATEDDLSSPEAFCTNYLSLFHNTDVRIKVIMNYSEKVEGLRDYARANYTDLAHLSTNKKFKQAVFDDQSSV